jgi:hypothetical protein
VSTPTFPDVVRGLRSWTRTHDHHVRAAVELLIRHESWPRRKEFLDACVRGASDHDGTLYIDWSAARRDFDAGEFDRASSTELAVLDFAISLGENRYLFSQMGYGNSKLLARAALRHSASARARRSDGTFEDSTDRVVERRKAPAMRVLPVSRVPDRSRWAAGAQGLPRRGDLPGPPTWLRARQLWSWEVRPRDPHDVPAALRSVVAAHTAWHRVD